jgi:hypothetical protein
VRPEIERRRRAAAPKSKPKKPVVTENATQSAILAQIKLDGDRLQAHLLSSTEVRLFTRNGFDVSDIYSDVRDELATRVAPGCAPCILDGELIVVDRMGEPLPWESAKWRFNGYDARRDPAVEEASPQNTNTNEAEDDDIAEGDIVMMPFTESMANYNEWDVMTMSDAPTTESELTFVPTDVLSKLGRWTPYEERDTSSSNGGTQHEKEQKKKKGPRRRYVIQAGSRLQYVLFDALMMNAEDITMLTCAARLERLKASVRLDAGDPVRFVSVIKVFLLL